MKLTLKEFAISKFFSGKLFLTICAGIGMLLFTVLDVAYVIICVRHNVDVKSMPIPEAALLSIFTMVFMSYFNKDEKDEPQENLSAEDLNKQIAELQKKLATLPPVPPVKP